MKKILVLMLVLGIASTASAGLTFSSAGATVGITGTTTVSLLVDSADVGSTDLSNVVGYYAGTVATLSTPAQGADVVAWGVSANTSPYVGYFTIVTGTTVTGGFQLNDEIAVLTLHGAAVGTYTIYVYDTASWTSPPGPTDSFVLTVIPEPMTIGLLGLGGLFLRRRK